jgi:D-serine deaminase-like pyridoxal phosphate-dependent protein
MSERISQQSWITDHFAEIAHTVNYEQGRRLAGEHTSVQCLLLGGSMFSGQAAVRELPAESKYQLVDAKAVLTPALIIYSDIVESNIRNTIRLLGGDTNRWRPHVKTAKLAMSMKLMMRQGVKQFKCATSLELLSLCECGAEDVLLAYTALGPNAVRVREIANRYTNVAVSALIDDEKDLHAWKGSRVGLFLDLNSGMDRTGMPLTGIEKVIRLIASIEECDIPFRGLHCYEGHLAGIELPERIRRAHAIYNQLLGLAEDLKNRGIAVPELVTSGTPAFACALNYPTWPNSGFLWRVSPGTVVYCDSSSLQQLPPDNGYFPAAVVLTRVISKPSANSITCDAGHKTLSVDRGVPNCVVAGHPDTQPLGPSEEHLPINIVAGGSVPALGEVLYLIPRHVCPTVNNFDHALIATDGRIVDMQRVTARGREIPLTGFGFEREPSATTKS